LHNAFGADARGGAGDKEQIATTMGNQGLEPSVQLSGAGGLRAFRFAEFVQFIDDAVDFRRFIHASPHLYR